MKKDWRVLGKQQWQTSNGNGWAIDINEKGDIQWGEVTIKEKKWINYLKYGVINWKDKPSAKKGQASFPV